MSVIKSVPEWIRGLVDFVFPPLCLGCGSYTEEPSAICPNCIKRIECFQHPFCLNCMDMIPAGAVCPLCKEKTLPLFAYGSYSSPLEDIVVQFKFKGIRAPGEYFAGLLCERFGSAIGSMGCSMVIPVPLYPARENHRGYNQAAVLAEALASRLEVAYRDDLLVRTQRRRLQARLSKSERASNIRGVYSVVVEARTDERVILVDDVVTSGATVREAVRVLKGGGYDVMAVVAIAHAP